MNNASPFDRSDLPAEDALNPLGSKIGGASTSDPIPVAEIVEVPDATVPVAAVVPNEPDTPGQQLGKNLSRLGPVKMTHWHSPTTADRLEMERRRGPQAMAANGGMVTSLILGAWALATAPLSASAFFVCVLGIVFGLWGLQSAKRNLAAVGIGLNILAATIIPLFHS